MEVKDKRTGKLALKTILLMVLLGAIITLSGSILAFLQFRNQIKEIFTEEVYQIADLVEDRLDLPMINSYFSEMYAASGEEEWIATGASYVNESYHTLQTLLQQIYDRFKLDQLYISGLGHPEPGEDNSYEAYLYAGLLEYDDEVYDVDPGSYTYVEDLSGEFTEILQNGTKRDVSLEGMREGGVLTLSGIVRIKYQEKVIGFISVEKSTALINTAAINYISSSGFASLIITALFVALFVFINRKTVIKPIQTITHAANTFIQNKAETSDELENIKTRDEIEILAQSVFSMEKDIQAYIDNIREMTAENERVETELNIAANIQKNLLPTDFPASNAYELYASMKPAKEVGGDFYDFFMVDEDHLAFIIADVSGKGVPAALFMVTAKTLLKTYTQFSKEEDKVFSKVNDILCENNEEGLFVTCWMGILELSTGTLRYVNAGHNPPAIFNNENGYTFLKGKRGLILAAMEGMKYRENEIVLKPGDRLFLYTDGVTEAHNTNNELYGEDRLIRILNETRKKSVREVLETIEKNLQIFSGNKEQFDDITMLMIQMKGEESHA